MRSEETEQRGAKYITIPVVVLDGWIGHNDRYLKWWTWLRREASWTENAVWFGDQQVYLQARQVLVTVNLLVKQWQVSKPTVIRFLQRLEREKLIERQKDSRKTIITITPIGWAESEVKPVVKETVKVGHEVDRQVLPQTLPLHLFYQEDNNIACGGLRTREAAAAKSIKSEEFLDEPSGKAERKIKSDNDSFDEIVSFFNEQMAGKTIPQVELKTPERRVALTSLMAQTGADIDKVKTAIRNAAASDFMNGKGPKGWVADFDWMMMPQHFKRVLENFYRNKQFTQVQYGTNGYQDPRRGVEASGTQSFAAGYDRPF